MQAEGRKSGDLVIRKGKTCRTSPLINMIKTSSWDSTGMHSCKRFRILVEA